MSKTTFLTINKPIMKTVVFEFKYVFLIVACLFALNLNAQNGSFKQVKHLKLTEAGLKAFKKFSKQTSIVNIKDAKLFPGKGFRLWVSKEEDAVVVTPEGMDSLKDLLSDSWEKREYPWPGGSTYTTTCWCIDKNRPVDGDDCEFDNSQGDEPIRIECVGSCGCNRTHEWETTDIAEWIYI